MSYDPYGQPTQQPTQYPQQPTPYPQQAAYAASPYATDPYAGGAAPKSKTTAALLAFFLGGLGIHNFYRGQKGRGIGHIVLAVISVVLYVVGIATAVSNINSSGTMSDSAAAGFGGAMVVFFLVAMANSIWAFVEFIMILVSKDGSLR